MIFSDIGIVSRANRIICLFILQYNKKCACENWLFCLGNWAFGLLWVLPLREVNFFRNFPTDLDLKQAMTSR